MRSSWRAMAMLVVCVSLVSSAEAAISTKFGAWAAAAPWYDSPIPLFIPGYDVRAEERIYAGSCASDADEGNCNGSTIFPLGTTFASAHKGFIYTIGDEPEQLHRNISGATTAEYFKRFALAIRDGDPNARFASPATSSLAWMDDFYAAYSQLPGAPAIQEWRFNICNTVDWASMYNNAANWAAAHGGTAVITAGIWCHDPQPVPPSQVLPLMQLMLNHLAADSRVSYVMWWSYDPLPAPHTLPNTLIDASGQLTPEGQLYLTYATGAASVQGNSLITSLVDFKGTSFDDYAEQNLSTSPNPYPFTVYENNGNATFTATTLTGQTPSGSDWDVLVGDFTGDGKADYADVHVPSGQVWIHQNMNGTSFSPSTWAFKDLRDGFEILAGDLDGDGRTDLIERQLTTGLVWGYWNAGNGSFPIINPGVSPGYSMGRTMIGPDWRSVVGDFNGDGRADIADQHMPSGHIWIHRIYPVNVTIPPPSPYAGTYTQYRLSTRAEGEALASATGPGSNWRTVIGDFDGDNYTDYADLWVPSGQMWIHPNNHDNTFQATWAIWTVNTGNYRLLASR